MAEGFVRRKCGNIAASLDHQSAPQGEYAKCWIIHVRDRVERPGKMVMTSSKEPQSAGPELIEQPVTLTKMHLQLGMGPDFLWHGAGYVHIARVTLKIFVCALISFFFTAGLLVVLIQAWIGLNIVMILDRAGPFEQKREGPEFLYRNSAVINLCDPNPHTKFLRRGTVRINIYL
jgi:hypothetical protein